MISRELQQSLFGCTIHQYDAAPNTILKELERHGINVDRPQPSRAPVILPFLELIGRDIGEHMEHISKDLVAPYLKLLMQFTLPIPEMPALWMAQPGWTRYGPNGVEQVAAPLEDIIVFDTEVLMQEGNLPTMAVALSPVAWYSWVTPSLAEDSLTSDSSMDSLIRLYATERTDYPKCVIGHFVSFDRARLLEEYQPQGTGARFLDTLSLHIAISGLTSTQRHLKTTATKHCFNNKLWKNYMKDHGENTTDPTELDSRVSTMDLQWISETSLNNLTDVYRLYCEKPPPQTKEARSVFEDGSRQEVRSQFQELMRYCATDVLMTFEVFQKLLPLFNERFPHPATLHGLLEMGSMYLPINESWTDYQKRADSVFAENERRQKRLLMQLADQTLKHYSDPTTDPQNDPWLWDLDWSKPKTISPKTEADKKFANLPKWYRELIPKPIKSNLDAGPALITAQMRIAPKLLRLCWQGLPLHYDQVLKWGVLIPGRAPQPYGDPRFYEDSVNSQPISPTSGDCRPQSVNPTPSSASTESIDATRSSLQLTIRPKIPVFKMSASGQTSLLFPYRTYLSYWLRAMQQQLLNDFNLSDGDTPHPQDGSWALAYCRRSSPSSLDDHLMRELERSVNAMPLEYEDRASLSATIDMIRELGAKQLPDCSDQVATVKPKFDGSVHEHLGEMQVRGSSFWLDDKRYQLDGPSKMQSHTKSRRVSGGRKAVDTVNPVLPMCWFHHLPHENGEGLPVGSPLSRSFQVHISTNRLHSAYNDSFDEHPRILEEPINSNCAAPSAGLANRLLQDRVHATFWQSYSKRVKDQMAVWLPQAVLPQEIRRDSQFNPDKRYGAILPQVITAGTVSRRAVEPLWLTASNADRNRLGSEIKAMVQSPPGYCFVGADVDSQEMWIAALIGDASIGFQGATPYGWMTLEGSKADGTDLHTKTAQLTGITRNEAKVLNYARLYGSGFQFTKHLLTKFSNLTPEQASLKASHLIRTTKGQRVNGHRNVAQNREKRSGSHFSRDVDISLSKWHGGTESAVFNQLESIARSSEPRTPVLKAQLTRALNPRLVKEDFLPSRINWVVQSSAVDYLHCMLLVMSWLIRKYQLPTRLCISIHDEVRYLCRTDAANRVALALQISNLLTRAFFAYQLGMRDLPESVAFFSSVEIDTCLRKNPDDDCITPSNPDGIQKTYNVPPGKSNCLTCDYL
ncbi:DNA polymerase gamma 1 [Paragonimus westermani]|uniref:Mitochondrial DNA polymerase catalytic subunit n=1 Tax=Paragonimus westermani TaxID=34504 RepID=A0A5J4NIE3_9TREM|nr:DNA polymerase gamma 1 [Paragonimus westermani]